ncbi:MAG: hypothetical protein ACK5MN_08995 [Lachnospiraceae bacterium]
MKCLICGSHYKSNDRYCKKCGQPLPKSQREESPAAIVAIKRPALLKRRSVAICLLYVVTISVLAGVFLYKDFLGPITDSGLYVYAKTGAWPTPEPEASDAALLAAEEEESEPVTGPLSTANEGTLSIKAKFWGETPQRVAKVLPNQFAEMPEAVPALSRSEVYRYAIVDNGYSDYMELHFDTANGLYAIRYSAPASALEGICANLNLFFGASSCKISEGQVSTWYWAPEKYIVTCMQQQEGRLEITYYSKTLLESAGPKEYNEMMETIEPKE